VRQTTCVARYTVSRLDSIGELTDAGVPFRPIRLELGITSFGVTSWTARAAGDPLINAHDEQDTGDEELFVVLEGQATFEVDGERVEASTGTLLHCAPGTQRTAVAAAAGTTILAIDGTPGSAYESRGWELWTGLAPLYAAGRHGELIERLGRIVAQHPEYPLLFYNLACSEALSGQHAEAIEHLGRAIGLSDEFLGHAKDDSDFAAIRHDPRFRELTNR
jgi:tetratricopeptide (TPR) repeat protein